MKAIVLSLALVAAPALAMGTPPKAGDVPQGTQPVDPAFFKALTVRYTCSQTWLASRPRLSTAMKAQQQHYARAALAVEADNLPVFNESRNGVVKVIADLEIKC